MRTNIAGYFIAILLSVAVIGAVGLMNSDTDLLPLQSVDSPKAEVFVEYPEQARIGELVVVDAGATKADSIKWKVVPETTNFLVIDDGRRAVFSSEVGGDYLFIVAAAFEHQVDVQTFVLQVDGAPNPTPSKPTATPSRFAQQVQGWLDSVSSTNRLMESARLAASFRDVAGATKPDEPITTFLARTQESNRAALGTSLDTWKPFLGELQTHLQSLADAGDLETTEDHIRVWRQIADALDTQ